MKKVIVYVIAGVLILAGLAAAVSCGTSSPTATSTPPKTDTQVKPPPGGTTGPDFTPAPTAEVVIKDLAFSPATITVAAGTTVTWTNQDSVSHTVTSSTGIFDSGTLSKGAEFSYTFNNAGDFEYYCSIHTTMVGHVIVE